MSSSLGTFANPRVDAFGNITADFTITAAPGSYTLSVSVYQGSIGATNGFPFTVTAVGTGGGGGIGFQELPGGLQDKNAFLGIFNTLLNWVFTIFIVLAILMVILAGLQFVTGGGNPSSVSEARQKLIWAIVGIVVALIAKGLPFMIRAIVAP